MRYAISPDTQFNNSGIGGVTKINYRNDFDFYKRYLIEANVNSPKTIQALLRQWDEELFSSHNDAKGHTNSENAETIHIDDDNDDEMAREMRMLELRSVSPQIGLDEDAGEAELLPAGDQLGNQDDEEDMYVPDNDIGMPAWMQAPLFPERQADPGPGDSDIDERAPHPGPSTPPTPAPAVIEPTVAKRGRPRGRGRVRK